MTLYETPRLSEAPPPQQQQQQLHNYIDQTCLITSISASRSAESETSRGRWEEERRRDGV
ncbi:hypothetical protein JOB18_019534 [Solea senegalensis]|uniref:Uncharacterized protein n=1 Tax=Solea senegalensis TaxID=28829 RepID=A0AAV6QVW8_SOLSE|nr:hypothetical protein JOB18_019534 [Solea senegalensis]